jgi:hypothetical protein
VCRIISGCCFFVELLESMEAFVSAACRLDTVLATFLSIVSFNLTISLKIVCSHITYKEDEAQGS